MAIRKQIDSSGVSCLDGRACADRYAISLSSWTRLVMSHSAPQPIRLGRLVRWKIEDLREWERDNCRPVHPARKVAD